MKSNHILFPFDKSQINATQKRKIAQLFKKGGAEVLEVEVDSKTSTTAGIKNRQINISFTDSQSVTMFVKESGDVYQVMVNKRRVPMKEQDDHEGAIKEIAARLEAGRTAFQKRLSKIKAPKPRGVKATSRKKVTYIQERKKALVEELHVVRNKIDVLKAAAEGGSNDDVAGSEPEAATESPIDNVVTYQLVKKNEYQYQIKQGRKVVDKIISVTGGWAVKSKIFDSVSEAVEWFKVMQKNTLMAFSDREVDVRVDGLIQEAA
jgi:hypothetical protein